MHGYGVRIQTIDKDGMAITSRRIFRSLARAWQEKEDYKHLDAGTPVHATIIQRLSVILVLVMNKVLSVTKIASHFCFRNRGLTFER